jgi:AAA family ATP:ADP antiporter
VFGLVAVGGTLGAIAGTAITGSVARTGLAAWLIIPAALLIETAVRCANALAHRVATTSASSSATGAHAHAAALPLGGAAFDGLTLVARSPYLLAIAIYTFAFGVVQTFLTFQQNHIVEATLAAGEERTAYFAWTENAAQSLTLLVQLFVTGALLRRVGVVGGLLVLPVVGVLGFAALGAAHVGNASALALVTAFWVLWRGLNHATMRPSREALYVPTRREEKFKAKSFTDTFAFRGGDLAGAWSFNAFTLASAAFAAIPLAAAWGVLGFWLGRRQRELAARSNAPAESVPVDSVETAN